MTIEQLMTEYSDVIIQALGIILAFVVWLQRRTNVQLQALKSQQMNIQSENDQNKAQLEIVRETMTNSFKNDERWQTVVSGITDKVTTAIERLDTTIDKTSERTANATDNAASMLEVVSQQLGNVNTSVQRTEAQSLQTLQVVTAQTQVTQSSVDSIKTTITQSFELVENALKTLQKRFDDMLEIQTAHVEAQSERHTEQIQKGEDMRRELKAVADAIATMTTVVSNIHRLVQTLEPPALPATTGNTETEEDDAA